MNWVKINSEILTNSKGNISLFYSLKLINILWAAHLLDLGLTGELGLRAQFEPKAKKSSPTNLRRRP